MAKLPSVATTIGRTSSTWRKRCRLAGLDLVQLRIAVPGRPALEDVGHEHVGALMPIPASSLSSSFPACADERDALLVLVETGAPRHEHQLGAGSPEPKTTCVARAASRRRVRASVSSRIRRELLGAVRTSVTAATDPPQQPPPPPKLGSRRDAVSGEHGELPPHVAQAPQSGQSGSCRPGRAPRNATRTPCQRTRRSAP